MKRRASLLFGLGVLVSLSMSVPTYAATDNTQSIPQTQEAQQNEEGTETSSYKISEKTENGQWQLQKQDGKVVTGQNGFYIMGEYCYYVDADGYICTGFVDAAADETTGKVTYILHLAKPQTVLRQVHTMHQKMEIHRKKAWEISRRAAG